MLRVRHNAEDVRVRHYLSGAGTASIGILLAVLLWALIHIFGNSQLGGYDHAVLVDTPYRLFMGQRPFRDFYLTTPPLFGIGGWLAYLVFGPSWASLLHLTAIFSIAAFVIQAGQFRCFEHPWPRALSFSFGFQVMAMVTGAYWWYNSTSLVIAALLLGQAGVLLKQPGNRAAWALFSLLGAAALLTKPNTAVIAVAGSFLVLGLTSESRRRLLLWGGLSLVMAPMILLALRIDPVALAGTYRSLAIRATPGFHRFMQDRSLGMGLLFLAGTLACVGTALHSLLKDLDGGRGGILGWRPWVAGLAVWVPAFAFLWTGSFWLLFPGLFGMILMVRLTVPALRIREATWPLLGCVMLGTGLFSCFTNSEPQVVAFPTMLLPCLVRDRGLEFPKLTKGSWLVGASLALLLGWSRYRVELIGSGLFHQALPTQKIEYGVPYFQGFQGSPLFKQVLEDVRELMEEARHAPSPPTVFFGPRMEWGYAAFREPSPIGLPIWWDPGVSFPIDSEGQVVRAFQQHQFDLCILFQGDLTRVPAALRRWLSENYRAERRGTLIVLRISRPEGHRR